MKFLIWQARLQKFRSDCQGNDADGIQEFRRIGLQGATNKWRWEAGHTRSPGYEESSLSGKLNDVGVRFWIKRRRSWVTTSHSKPSQPSLQRAIRLRLSHTLWSWVNVYEEGGEEFSKFDLPQEIFRSAGLIGTISVTVDGQTVDRSVHATPPIRWR